MDELLQEDLPQEELARVARGIITGLAPAELMLFRTQCEDYFRDPKAALAQARARERAMGFGAHDAVQMLTPFVLAALTGVMEGLGKELGHGLGASARERARELVGRLFGGRVALTPAQVEQVRAIAASRAGADPEIARRVADGVVAAVGPGG